MGYLISLLRAFALIILPILILIIPTAFSQESSLLRKVCTNTSQNYTIGSTYSKNVKVLLDDLVTKTPQNHSFWKESLPGIYGLALCRGDVSADDCDFCLYDARCKIAQRCYKKSAIVWYDYCQVKYSDVNFFGKVDHENDHVSINVVNVTNRIESFRAASLGLLSNLSEQASNTTNKYMFARGEELFDEKENVTIHGMALCTRDLSYDSCKTCLDRVVQKLPIYKGGIYSVGARVFGGSCTVRYEPYVFLNDDNNKA